MLIQIFEVMAPVCIITLIGFIMGRTTLQLETQSLGTIVILVATPALIFHTLTSLDVQWPTIQKMATAAICTMACAGLMAFIGLRALGGRVRSFLPLLMLPNSGNLGLPLVLLAFGDEGLQLGIAFFFAVSLVQHTIGLSIYAGSARLGMLLRQPLIYAVLAALIVTWTDITLPNIVMTTTEMLAGMMIPAMLILLGLSVATLRVSDIGLAVMIAVGRLAIGMVTATLVVWFLDLSGVMAGTVFLFASMPTAIVNYILAERYQQDAPQVAGAVVVSTLLTFACLPGLLWVALAIAGTS